MLKASYDQSDTRVYLHSSRNADCQRSWTRSAAVGIAEIYLEGV